MRMSLSSRLARARQLIENEGEAVTYHGVKWFYLRKYYGWTQNAVRVLEREGKLVRWSKKTPRLVRMVD